MENIASLHRCSIIVAHWYPEGAGSCRVG
jgi:hypothetical protein